MAARTHFHTESYILADYLILRSSGILTGLQSSLSDVLNLITNAENSALHKYVIKNGRSVFGAIQKLLGMLFQFQVRFTERFVFSGTQVYKAVLRKKILIQSRIC